MAMNSPLYPDAKSLTSLEDGLRFQDFVRPLLLQYGILAVYYTSREYQLKHGESVYGIEIKLDNLCTKTGRLSIEVAEKGRASNASYVPSGIYRADNTWLYVHGNYERFFVFAKKYLRVAHVSGKYQTHDKPTIKTFYIPMADAERICLLDIKPPAMVQKLKDAA